MSDHSVVHTIDAAVSQLTTQLTTQPTTTAPAAAYSPETLAHFRDMVTRETLRPYFQPIVDVRQQEVFGYEALIRGAQDSALFSAYDLFRCAETLAIGDEFEVVCRKLSIQKFVHAGLPHRLFLNASPSLLLAGDFKQGKTLQFLRECNLDPKRVVIEVTEQQQTSEYSLLNTALQQYRAMGFQVALDDLGAGYSSLRLWKELLPDFIKVDKHFIRDIHLHKLKQSFVKGLLEMSAGSNCRLIVEGVEKQAEFEYLHSLGIILMQGFFFARPAEQPPRHIDSALLTPKARAIPERNPGLDNLLAISKVVEPIPFTMKVKEVLERFQKNAEIDLIPVVNSSRPVGLVERYSFLNKILHTIYSISLYGKQRIVDFLDHEPILVDINTNLETVSQTVTSQGNRVHGFIVTESNKYYGVSTVLDLLHKITQQQIKSARHANPLTLLPGIVPTNEIINALLASHACFSLVYYDLDNFKPYNDHYGYEAGDRVIKRFAALLQEVYGAANASICHIGGDDFVVIDKSNHFVEHCEQAFELFAQEIPTFYAEEHVAAGGIEGFDRQNRACFYALLSTSAGIVPPSTTKLCHSHIEIADYANEAKKQAKRIDGNSLFVNRRNTGEI
jgi:diguanylate cyclase (GGDEF)-like protein